jgi:hypothetical protein
VCPIHSEGDNVRTGCACLQGFSGGITATTTTPHHTGACTPPEGPEWKSQFLGAEFLHTTDAQFDTPFGRNFRETMTSWVYDEGSLLDDGCVGASVDTSVCMQTKGNGDDFAYDCNREVPENHMTGDVTASAKICITPWPDTCTALECLPDLYTQGTALASGATATVTTSLSASFPTVPLGELVGTVIGSVLDLGDGPSALDPLLDVLDTISIDDLALDMSVTGSTAGTASFALGASGSFGTSLSGGGCDPQDDCKCGEAATAIDYVKCIAIMVATPRGYVKYSLAAASGGRRRLALAPSNGTVVARVLTRQGEAFVLGHDAGQGLDALWFVPPAIRERRRLQDSCASFLCYDEIMAAEVAPDPAAPAPSPPPTAAPPSPPPSPPSPPGSPATAPASFSTSFEFGIGTPVMCLQSKNDECTLYLDDGAANTLTGALGGSAGVSVYSKTKFVTGAVPTSEVGISLGFKVKVRPPPAIIIPIRREGAGCASLSIILDACHSLPVLPIY